MKRWIPVAAVLAMLVLGVASAQAFHWHMQYGQAKHASKEFIVTFCKEESECTGYGVGRCQRVTDSRIDCEVGAFYANSPSPGEETECNIPLHWGVNRSGVVVLKNYGNPHCFQL